MKGRLERRLRLRFVALAAGALVAMQVLIVGLAIAGNYRQMTRKADRVLWLTAADPTAPEAAEARYFRVVCAPDGQVLQTDLGHTTLVTHPAAAEYARQVLASGKDRGYLDIYRYHVHREEGRVRVTFLSRSAAIQAFHSAARTLVLVSLAGIGAMTAMLAAVSGRVVAPLVRNRERQRAFITSASHALKTPLAVIQADAQLLETEVGENPWLADILAQTAHMTRMTNRLVFLARDEERAGELVKIDFPLSDVVQETAESYRAVAADQGKALDLDIQRDLSCRGDEGALRELVTVLLDNAFQYSPAGGQVALGLSRRGRMLTLTVENTVQNPDPQILTRPGQRFYRPEASERPSFGIGLSVAQAVARAHGGSLTGRMVRDDVIQFTATFEGTSP